MRDNQITVIGAANIDIHGFSFDQMIYKESNPGRVKFCLGGVGRNISENLARVGMNVSLISAIGGDANSRWLLSACTEIGIDMTGSIIFEDSQSSIYLDLMNSNGDMELGLSDLVVLEMMTPAHLIERHHLINSAKAIVLDTGLSEATIYHVLDNYAHVPIFIDPVSSPKAKKIKGRLKGIHTLKLNKLEAAFLTDIDIKDQASLKAASAAILKQGVKRVFITLGDEGVYYQEGSRAGSFKAATDQVVNATGAGDAFMAGTIYAFIKGYGLEETAKVATGFALITLSDENTVNPNISEEAVFAITGSI
jgi:pseudouridine kinase